MPHLARAPNERELEHLLRVYMKAETDIINEIARLRSRGLVDYHAVAALERVQTILREMVQDTETWAPRVVEKMFYVRVPEARTAAGKEEPAAKHLRGYLNAGALTGEQHSIVDRLVQNLVGQVSEAAADSLTGLQSMLIGRTEPDLYRRVGLEQVAAMQAAGRGFQPTARDFVEALRREGVTAFTDRAGRNWSLHSYCGMAARTTSRQAEVLAVLTADPEQDLYRISAHGTTCALCAPYEGRVYSLSGTDPDFPPLSDAFGKMDKNGPEGLANSWLNIHPGCLHALLPWTPAGRSPEELERIKRFSSPKTNPYSRDPRTEEQITAYRKKEAARAQWRRDYRQWEKYRTALGDEVPRTFATFQKHKQAGDKKYQKWGYLYRRRNDLLTNAAGQPIIRVDRSTIKGYPNSITQKTNAKGGIDRNYYDADGRQYKQISNNGHGHPKEEAIGRHGEHAHAYLYDPDGHLIGRPARELTSQERKENADFL